MQSWGHGSCRAHVQRPQNLLPCHTSAPPGDDVLLLEAVGALHKAHAKGEHAIATCGVVEAAAA